MCEWKPHGDTKIDPCMRKIVGFINKNTTLKTIMCCCGHGKGQRQPSLIVLNPDVDDQPIDIFSGVKFKHGQKRFYKRDKEGYYYIPEVTEKK